MLTTEVNLTTHGVLMHAVSTTEEIFDGGSCKYGNNFTAEVG